MKKNILLVSLIILVQLLFAGALFAQNNPPFPPGNGGAPLDNNTLYLLLGGLAFAGNYVYGFFRKNKKR